MRSSNEEGKWGWGGWGGGVIGVLLCIVAFNLCPSTWAKRETQLPSCSLFFSLSSASFVWYLRDDHTGGTVYSSDTHICLSLKSGVRVWIRWPSQASLFVASLSPCYISNLQSPSLPPFKFPHTSAFCGGFCSPSPLPPWLPDLRYNAESTSSRVRVILSRGVMNGKKKKCCETIRQGHMKL